MLSIIDLKDYIDLDIDTVHVVKNATRLSIEEAIVLANQFLGSEAGRAVLHHMYCDQIDQAADKRQSSRENELRRAYKDFSRKYPNALFQAV